MKVQSPLAALRAMLLERRRRGCERCVARDDRVLVADLAAGAHTFVVDTYVGADGGARAGEYLFVLVRE